METRYSADPERFPRMTTEELRKNFLVDSLFTPDRLRLVYSDLDRVIVGSAVPEKQAVPLVCPAELRAAFFLERREAGILNVGGKGTVTVDGKAFPLEKNINRF